jgi:2,4-dienoyl-CoA reductase-like NADH-dependent reductase (Old Yellow Enzyme family)
MSHLFEPLSLRGITLRNRIGVSPMCQYSCVDGMASDWHVVHHGSRAVGGAGLIIQEATAVEARGCISLNDVGLWSDKHIEPLARLNHFILEQGAVPGVQIAHAGRKAGIARLWEGGKPLTDSEGGWTPVGASALPFDEGFRVPHELSLDEIHDIQGAFRTAAQRALAADFRFLELHAAHGYLLHSFYSPLSNHRTDTYGGSFENRIRMTLETAASIREVWPDTLPLAARLSCTDWTAGGWTLEESVELARRLKALGVDLVDCSSGGNLPHATVPTGASYQVPFSESIRRGAEIATTAVGLITEPMQADEIIRNGRADLVLLGRESMRDPYWPLHAARALGQKAPVPVQYERAYR